ncbi:wall-associated receptor kinase 1-like [Hibiscus syriacus]|uniref:Wall-associated receptor kinase 1-like n=1 Tax=Hibiscus syriacus TaxID=106335 RepID=A0A6A2YFL9_HIBSY|nr:wall-associated receptor kinase 1-like [Hibiscus syriacus]
MLRHTRSGLLAAMLIYREESNYEEVSMQRRLLLSDILKDFKNLRTQLYSAAEYFELSYSNDDHKQMVNEVSGTELRVSCFEERVRKCQEYIDHERISQQSSMIKTPKYHKRYILPGNYPTPFSSPFSRSIAITGKEYLAVFNVFDQIPVGETLHGANQTKSKYQGYSLDDEDNCHRFRNAVRATIREVRSPQSVGETSASSIRRGRSPSPSPQPRQRSTKFSFTVTMPKKELEKRAVSPHRFPRLSCGSDSRPTTHNKSRSSTPNSDGARRRFPSEPRKSAVDFEKDNTTNDIEQYLTKNIWPDAIVGS